MHRSIVDDFICSLAGAADEDAARDVLKAAIAHAGLESYAYLGLRIPGAGERPRPYFLTTYPADWVEAYDKSDYLRLDPILLETPSRNAPWVWGSDDHRRRLSREQVRFLDEAKTYGIRTGIAIPVHAAGGEFGLVSISSDESEQRFHALLKDWQHDLHLIALYYHSHVSRFIDRVNQAEAAALTVRERECLLWSAIGKSSWEIGQILKISEATVNFHVKNAMRKLGVFSRPHAVVRAIMLGIISP